MMGFGDHLCNTGLTLRLGLPSTSTEITPRLTNHKQQPKAPGLKLDELAKGATNFKPSLTLSLSGEKYHDKLVKKVNCVKACYDIQESGDSGASSFSNVNVKRDREVVVSEEAETTTEKVSSRASDEDEDGSNRRKKLRLTKAQSAVLEESFKHHSTLNPRRKQELARELNLRPRQVEVWFQNRRARTKLKQTEADCEFLKKCCQTLTDENRRLQEELQQLKALKVAQPLYMQLPAATTLTMCPSCERIGGPITETAAKNAFNMAAKPHFCNPFNHSSAAC